MEVPSVNLGKILGLGSSDNATKNAGEDAPVTGALGGKSDQKSVTADKTPVVDSKVDTVTADTTVKPAVVDETSTTVVEDVAPEVEHETVIKEHEQKEKTIIDKERHQDHYHTTVVPAQAQEVLPEEHRYEDTATEVKEFEHDDGAAKSKNNARNAGFKDTTEQGVTKETKTDLGAEGGHEQVHHHLHETIQPVIEKETIKPITTHKTYHVKEVHHDAAVDEGTTTEAPVSVEELESKIERVKPTEERY